MLKVNGSKLDLVWNQSSGAWGTILTINQVGAAGPAGPAGPAGYDTFIKLATDYGMKLLLKNVDKQADWCELPWQK